MFVIWKFVLQVKDVQVIRVPKGAEILTVQTQGITPAVWVKVNPELELEDRELFIYGTGYEVPVNKKYVGTFQERNGSFVWHLFE